MREVESSPFRVIERRRFRSLDVAFQKPPFGIEAFPQPWICSLFRACGMDSQRHGEGESDDGNISQGTERMVHEMLDVAGVIRTRRVVLILFSERRPGNAYSPTETRSRQGKIAASIDPPRANHS